jgi:hypothetical protein
MPEIIISLHELINRHAEVPNEADCYLVGIWTDDINEGEEDEEGPVIWKTPWKALEFPPLRAARDDMDPEDWNYQWGGDHCRIGCNTPSFYRPIYLRFRWGEGVPGDDFETPMLPHEPAEWDVSFRFCKHCGKQVDGAPVPQDCPVRRLRSLADAVLVGEAAKHTKAVDRWHKAKG